MKTILLGIMLSVALFSARVMAADFHALAVLQGTAPASLPDAELAATEGGATCQTPTAPDGGWVTLCIWSSGGLGGFAHFVAGNALPVTAAQFLQIVD